MGRDTGIGVGLLVLAGLLYWQAGKTPVPPFVPIGPAFYPRVILVILAALAVWLIVQDVLVTTRGKRPAVPGQSPPPPNYRLVVLCFVTFGLYVIGLSLIGYLAATSLFVLGLGWLMGPRAAGALPKLIAVAIGTALATYLIFEKYLHVFLPRGLIF
jgi:hypothetical protein